MSQEEGGGLPRGRPPSGPALVDKLDGPEPAKRRMKAFLETLSGSKSVAQACTELGLGEAAFHKQRSQWLQGAVELLAPRPPGRPPKADDPQQRLIDGMQQQIFELKKEAQAARLRAEIAIAMPHLLVSQNEDEAGKKKTRPKEV
jgi:hypothetical protein